MRILIFFLVTAATVLNACSNDTTKSTASAESKTQEQSADTTSLLANVSTIDTAAGQPDTLAVLKPPASIPAVIKTGNEHPFRLLQATSEEWRSGTRGGGRGTEYYFRIRIEKNGDLEFDSAWIGQVSHPVFISKESSTATKGPVTYSRGDTVVVRVSHIASSGTDKIKTDKSAAMPYKGAALLIYRFKDIRKSYPVPIIKKQEGPNRS